jgi:hypothetical protein
VREWDQLNESKGIMVGVAIGAALYLVAIVVIAACFL